MTLPSVRIQLFSITSLVILCLVVVLAVWDYRREVRQHVLEKQSDLHEEAKAVLPGIVHTREHGPEAVQAFIDSVSSRMHGIHSPNHHIAVKVNEEFYEASAYHKVPIEQLEAMKVSLSNPASDGRHLGNRDFLLGIYSDGNVTVVVTEGVVALRSAVAVDELFRFAGIIFTGMAAAVIVHLLLLRLVSGPLEALAAEVRLVGQGVYDSPIRSFGSLELNILSTEINAMSDALAYAEADRNSRLQKAREIQQNLLPHAVEIPGVSIGKIYCPAEEVGGDYLDILPQENDRWLVCIADATGHGVPAAMSAAMLKTLLLHANDGLRSPAAILHEMNKVFMQVHVFGDFASVVLCQIDLNSKQLTYANAGHDPAWYIHSTDRVRELGSTGTLLGINAEETWENEAFKLAKDSRLAISTDGITETFNAEGVAFGKARLLESLLANASVSVQDTAERIYEDVVRFRSEEKQLDDVTLLLLEC